MMQQKHHIHWIQSIQIYPLDINILNHWIQSIQISPLEVNILRLNMTMMHGHASKDSTMQNHLIYIQQPQCKRSPPFTLINSNNNCIIKYLRPQNQQVTIQIRVITALSLHNYHHNYRQTSTISYSLTIPCNFSQSK
jgi:hypothetical protein